MQAKIIETKIPNPNVFFDKEVAKKVASKFYRPVWVWWHMGELVTTHGHLDVEYMLQVMAEVLAGVAQGITKLKQIIDEENGIAITIASSDPYVVVIAETPDDETIITIER